VNPFSDIVVIVGRRKAGKTFLAKNLYLRNVDSIVVDDHTFEYREFPRVRRPAELLRYPRVVFEDREANDQSFRAMFEAVKKRHKKFGGTLLVIDEAHVHFERKKLPPAQSQLIRYGRHYGIGVVLISHRVYDFNPLVYKLADYVIIFKTTEPRELDFIRKYVGYGAEDKVRRLGKYEFVLVDVNEGRVSGPYRLRPR